MRNARSLLSLLSGDPGERPSWTETPLNRDLPWTETPLNRDLPWTEIPLDRDTLGKRPPRQRPPDRDPLDRDTPDRDPPGHVTCSACWDRHAPCEQNHRQV